ncbi:MAG: 3-keto-5-aminohexanoate cleavage protein, partial [Solirubrobacterales bacterium]|nr:3-keto-5-aminohexanoate cleavage protein [Solirubrobacterales bacterium]
MSVDDPAIVSCAISGAIANRDQCRAIPYTPAEYAAEARRIVDEGGVQIHVHERLERGDVSDVEAFVLGLDAQATHGLKQLDDLVERVGEDELEHEVL